MWPPLELAQGRGLLGHALLMQFSQQFASDAQEVTIGTRRDSNGLPFPAHRGTQRRTLPEPQHPGHYHGHALKPQSRSRRTEHGEGRRLLHAPGLRRAGGAARVSSMNHASGAEPMPRWPGVHLLTLPRRYG